MVNRRQFVTAFSGCAAALLVTLSGVACKKRERPHPYTCQGLRGEPLLAANDFGLMLPAGYTSRILARSGKPPVAGNDFVWHNAPDGGACFETNDQGWIYVANSEVLNGGGGASALRFNQLGVLIDAYPVLRGTTKNCAGGKTPWQTWLSCEEHDRGLVWECDPFGLEAAIPRNRLGVFTHEAAAVDPLTLCIYMSEDKADGRFYRFRPTQILANHRPDLDSGVLEVATVDPVSLSVTWLTVPDPEALAMPTRYQIGESTPFNGGEGLTYFGRNIYLATKGDNRIWVYHIDQRRLAQVFDGTDQTVLSGVDNLNTNESGDLLVAEDGGDMQIVVINQNNEIFPLCQLLGHDGSEITGLSFSPDGRRLYFSSQRGTMNRGSDGYTFEISLI